MSLHVPWWAIPVILIWGAYTVTRKYFMRILLVLLIILAMIGWNKGWWGTNEKPANAPVAVQAQEPSMVDSVKQWFVDHTPKK